LEGVLSVAGASLTWFIEQFEQVSKQEAADNQMIFDRLELEASRISPGSDGLFFMPHLMGERCPENANARGVLYGLSLGHTRAHIVRSMYEGTTFALKRGIELVEERAEVESKTYRIFGGGSKSRLLPKILANVLAKPVLLPKEEEVCALGLALIASAKLKQRKLETDKRAIETRDTVQPQSDLVSRYEKFYGIFKRIEETLTPAYNYSSTLD
jgi:xylulokinase